MPPRNRRSSVFDFMITTELPEFAADPESCGELPTVREAMEFFGRIDSLEAWLTCNRQPAEWDLVTRAVDRWQWLWLDEMRRMTALDARHLLSDAEVLNLMYHDEELLAFLLAVGLVQERVRFAGDPWPLSYRHSIVFPAWMNREQRR